MLEKQLAEIDTEETTALFLGSSRCDNNVQRTTVLSDINVALADYGKLCSTRPIPGMRNLVTVLQTNLWKEITE
jgi:hypothetical protein